MKKYVFKPYSDKFPLLFEQEKNRLLETIKLDLVIEHIGSTAVPGLGGKGIIDLAIGAKKKDFDEITKQLQRLGYEFRPSFSTETRLYFIIFLPDEDEGTRRYHIHLMDPESQEWKDMLLFRDHLRSYPEDAKHYADLKKKAAEEANQEGEKYRSSKTPFFKKILKN